MNAPEVKLNVKKAYTEIVKNRTSCCGTSACGCSGGKNFDSAVQMKYRETEGYVPDADYGLGCGLPVETAGIREGDTVVDLGCGAGNDVFIARKAVGEKGRVIGIDMTEAMLDKARKN
ncbi:MAG: methyltransferase domain-containing protein, partial [Spirochaetota bacterium]